MLTCAFSMKFRDEGMFRVKIVLGENYPTAPPKGFFVTKIFHPNVDSKGSICVNTLKKDWKKEYGIVHVLTVIKCTCVPFIRAWILVHTLDDILLG